VDQPVVVLLYYGHNYPNRTAGCVATITEKISEYATILPIAFTKVSGNKMDILEKILLEAAGKKVDLIINFMAFRLGAGPMGGDAQTAVELLEKLNVPVVHPYFMSRCSHEHWLNTEQAGISQYLISIMLPELDGCIETYPVAAIETISKNEEFNLELNELKVIDERVDKLAARVKNWLRLKNKDNNNKKIAIICYNYPPGEDNIFGGAFLDTFASVEKLLRLLKKEGYSVNNLTAEQLREEFTAGKIVNSGRWSQSDASSCCIKYNSSYYEQDFNYSSYREEVYGQWGSPPGGIMSEDEDFLIPGLKMGNVFVGLQPSRGLHENPDKVYHDSTLLPHHQYLAFYKWIRDMSFLEGWLNQWKW
jgi:cobaltochelatase CobN